MEKLRSGSELAAKKPASKAELAAFCDECAGVSEVAVVRSTNIVDRLPAALLLGDPFAIQLVRAIVQWRDGLRLSDGERPLCLDCDHEFGANTPPPGAFILVVPHGGEPTKALLIGVCADCAAVNDPALMDK